MAIFEHIVRIVSKSSDRVAQAGVVVMMLLVVANILLRMVWKPIVGTFDYVQFIGATLVAFAVAYCAFEGGHISVEMVVARFPKRVQGIIGSFTSILSLGIFGIIAWQCLIFAGDAWRVGETSMGTEVPIFPYV